MIGTSPLKRLATRKLTNLNTISCSRVLDKTNLRGKCYSAPQGTECPSRYIRVLSGSLISCCSLRSRRNFQACSAQVRFGSKRFALSARCIRCCIANSWSHSKTINSVTADWNSRRGVGCWSEMTMGRISS